MGPKPPFDLETALGQLPAAPGIYRMYNAAGELLYVGKAKRLKNRVRSYFQKNQDQLSPRIRVMVSLVERFDYVITDTEAEALILESNLVKTHHPKYNILLRDDKKFPWIAISNEPFPRIYITRKPDRKSGARYFGPYTDAGAMYETLHVLRKHFPLRQRRKPLFRNRPCMNYYLGSCLAPCQNLVSEAEYADIVRQVELFLKGRVEELLDAIEQEMQMASENLNYEWAAKLRDRYRAVERLANQQMVTYQKMISDDDSVNRDVIAMAADDLRVVIVVMKVRRGKLMGTFSREISRTHGATPEEVYGAFLPQYYADHVGADLPDEMVLAAMPAETPEEDEEVFQAWINQARGKQVALVYPQRGMKKQLLDLAEKNARELLEQYKSFDAQKLRADPMRILMALQEVLQLPDFPSRIECYDISHVQGTNTVASMVVFTDGQPDKAAYRRFKIKTAEGKPDDFKSMAEVIERRFSHRRKKNDSETLRWDDPDLVIIDGGKGQLGAAVSALEALEITHQPIISLAKKFEEVFVPGKSRPILIPRDSEVLFLLQQIRDEAHRFAIGYHRTLRAKAATRSVLDDIPGIGKKRKEKLLEVFGSVEKMSKADIVELMQQGGLSEKLAENIHQTLRKNRPEK